MNPNPIPRSSAARWLLWWIIWAGVAAGLVAINFAIGRLPESTAAGRTVGADVVGLAELLASCLARWWGLPRIRRVQPAFVLFVAGLALAEACGLIGVFLGAHRNELVVLGVLGMLQWVPLFARRYFRPSTAALPPPER